MSTEADGRNKQAQKKKCEFDFTNCVNCSG
jgi:hypothetical protein